jgi:hypothetical protein
MKLKKLILALVLTVVSAPALFAEAAGGGAGLTVRTFQFHYKQADHAATLLKSLVSADGSVSIQPGSNTLVVTDHTENLRAIAATISQYDVPSRGFRLEMRLISAARATAPAKVPDDLQDVSSKLSGVLRFNSFEKMGELASEGHEGDAVIANLSDTYRAEFKFGEFDPLSNSIRVADFHLSKVQPGDKSGNALTSLLRTSLNLKVGQTVILGASRLPDSQRALMLVLVAKPLN